MSIKRICVLILTLTWLVAPLKAENIGNKPDMRTFLYTAHIDAKGWQVVMQNPSDREAASRESIRQLGGELHFFYFDLGQNKNYALVSLPNAEIGKAMQVLRMSSGMLHDFTFTELITSADMIKILKDMQKLHAVDDL